MVVCLALAAALSGEPVLDDVNARLDWFRKARIGMFIHWGPVSLKGTEIGWSRGAEVPVEEYDKLYLRFNPVKFDANAWMQLAQDAGFRYVVPTARHHDGFCLWPSKLSDYTIAQTPFKRDIMGEIAGAAKRHGLAMCSYYSILDWHHPLYGTDSPGGKKPKPHPDMAAFMDYAKGQLKELVRNYDLKMVWFDGCWEAPYTAAMATDLESYMRTLKPGLIINNRVGKVGSSGDYDTPEQRVGSFQRGRAWETCMTLCQQWAWKPDDQLKSFPEVLRILVETVTGDGNLLLNVGPMPDGQIEPRQADRLRELGAWLRQYGDSVYGTRGGPYMNGAWGGSTCQSKSVYLHILKWNGREVVLPALPAKMLRFKSLTGNAVKVVQNPQGLTVTQVGMGPVPIDTVIRLDLDKTAFDIAPIAVKTVSG
ncbi:MAG: alpha-L-fucosidase [Fimbriimonadales bacterium]